MLFYVKGRFATAWWLGINPNNILSEHVVNVLYFLPLTINYILFYLLCVFLIAGIFTKRRSIRFMCWSYSLYRIGLTLYITFNILSLHDFTDLFLMRIVYPISVDVKYHFLYAQLDTSLFETKPHIYFGNDATKASVIERCTAIIQGYSPDKIQTMSIQKLHETASDVYNYQSMSQVENNTNSFCKPWVPPTRKDIIIIFTFLAFTIALLCYCEYYSIS